MYCFLQLDCIHLPFLIIFGGVFRVFMLSVSIDGFIFLSNLDVFFFSCWIGSFVQQVFIGASYVSGAAQALQR